jgi:hypothetical protein
MNRMSGRPCFSAMINRYSILNEGRNITSFLGLKNPDERAIAEILMIDKVRSSVKLTG